MEAILSSSTSIALTISNKSLSFFGTLVYNTLLFCSPLFESSTMVWIYMVTTGSLTAWLLHFLLVAVCLLPEFLVSMAETRSIHKDIVDSEVSKAVLRALPLPYLFILILIKRK